MRFFLLQDFRIFLEIYGRLYVWRAFFFLLIKNYFEGICLKGYIISHCKSVYTYIRLILPMNQKFLRMKYLVQLLFICIAFCDWMWANGFVPSVYNSETFCRLVDMHPSNNLDTFRYVSLKKIYDLKRSLGRNLILKTRLLWCCS